MRIAFDYGLGPRFPGIRPPRPGEETVTRQVLVLRRGEAGNDDKVPVYGTKPDSEGIPIPGTDFRLTVSGNAEARDREVRAHEQSHLAQLGGAAASGIIYETRLGPDGKQYAVGGRIKTDLSPVPGDPRATLDKARSVIRAALAPGSPSAADMRVAAEAYRLAREAGEELSEQAAGRKDAFTPSIQLSDHTVLSRIDCLGILRK